MAALDMPPNYAGAELTPVQVVSSVFGPDGRIVSPCPGWLRLRVMRAHREGRRVTLPGVRGFVVNLEARQWIDRANELELHGVFLSDPGSVAAWKLIPQKVRLRGPPWPTQPILRQTPT